MVVVPVMAIVEVPALKVRPVVVAAFHGVLADVAVRLNSPLPRLSVRVPVPVMLNPVVPLSVALLLFTEKSSVPVNAPAVMDWTVTVVLTVTVPPPLDPSNVTESAEPGTVWPPSPPDVADQFTILEPSHVPVPKTQNRLATG